MILCLWSIYGYSVYPNVRGGVARCLVTVAVQASVPWVVFRPIGFYNEAEILESTSILIYSTIVENVDKI